MATVRNVTKIPAAFWTFIALALLYVVLATIGFLLQAAGNTQESVTVFSYSHIVVAGALGALGVGIVKKDQ